MIVLINGSSHTGKTLLAQKLLEKYAYPYLSIDHLKMGLIRSKQTKLNVEDDEALTSYLWPIIKEICKTAIESKQNLIIEGCYIPFAWRKDFTAEYLEHIKHYCLIMTKSYITKNFCDIKQYANSVEQRLDNSELDQTILIKENIANLKLCKKYGCNYILIHHEYKADIDLNLP